jgi:hypothetical protein
MNRQELWKAMIHFGILQKYIMTKQYFKYGSFRGYHWPLKLIQGYSRESNIRLDFRQRKKEKLTIVTA